MAPLILSISAPGVVRRAAAAARDKHVSALTPKNLKVVFATHLHSDHTAGLSDLYLTPAVEGRPGALELYGPPGIADMARHIQAAYVKDVDIRVHGLEHGNRAAYRINAHEIHPGIVYQDANVTVSAFAVAHGTWDFSYGYRFDTADRSIVISGDTAPTQAVARACHGCDLLLHEVYSTAWFRSARPSGRNTIQPSTPPPPRSPESQTQPSPNNSCFTISCSARQMM